MCVDSAASEAAAAQTLFIIRNDVIIYNNNFSKKSCYYLIPWNLHPYTVNLHHGIELCWILWLTASFYVYVLCEYPLYIWYYIYYTILPLYTPSNDKNASPSPPSLKQLTRRFIIKPKTSI